MLSSRGVSGRRPSISLSIPATHPLMAPPEMQVSDSYRFAPLRSEFKQNGALGSTFISKIGRLFRNEGRDSGQPGPL